LKNKTETNDLNEIVVVAFGCSVPGSYVSREALLTAALATLPSRGLKILEVSRCWSSLAWPDPKDPAYRNGVALIRTDLGPRDVLAVLHEVETEFGRVRGATNAPRTLDLDLIAYGRMAISADDLCIPHPRAHERRFVMGPLSELAPEWLHPVLGHSAAHLAEHATVGRDALALALPGSSLWTSASEAGISAPLRKKGDIPGGVA